jgi:hypothetical protein
LKHGGKEEAEEFADRMIRIKAFSSYHGITRDDGDFLPLAGC